MGSNAKTGTSSSAVTTAWAGASTKNKFFKNLRESGTVTMVANWTAVAFNLPTVTKTGYTCTWNTKSDGSGTSYNSGASYTPSAISEASITLYASCSANTFTVAYDANGGSGTTASHTCTYDGTCKLASNGFTRSGYTFTGWKKANTGDTLAAGSSIKNAATSGTVTYYAQWAISSTLTIKPNGGTWNGSGSNRTITKSQGDTYTIADPVGPTYTITYRLNGTGASMSGGSTSATVPFYEWAVSGGGSLSGTTFTFGSSDTVLTASYGRYVPLPIPNYPDIPDINTACGLNPVPECAERYWEAIYNLNEQYGGNCSNGSCTVFVSYAPVSLPTLTKEGYNCKWSGNGDTYESGGIAQVDSSTIFSAECTSTGGTGCYCNEGGELNQSTGKCVVYDTNVIGPRSYNLHCYRGEWVPGTNDCVANATTTMTYSCTPRYYPSNLSCEEGESTTGTCTITCKRELRSYNCSNIYNP